MADRRYPTGYACTLCSHEVNDHNVIVGCTKCDCMASPGEAQTERPGTIAAPVHYPNRQQRSKKAIWIIERVQYDRDQDNRDRTRAELEEDFGFFTTLKAAEDKCATLNATVHAEYVKHTQRWKEQQYTKMLYLNQWAHSTGQTIYEPAKIEEAS